jgi:6-phosphofructokinase 1
MDPKANQDQSPNSAAPSNSPGDLQPDDTSTLVGSGRIALLTSGGDAPGMNAAIRAVVRCALSKRIEVIGVQRGYAGLIAGELNPLRTHQMANILMAGGTVLRTARCPDFLKAPVRAEAAERLRQAGVQGLVVLGGDGSFQGAEALSRESGLEVIGIPCTIDNDIFGTDSTIGFDTAVNTALEALDRIRDTAASHDRLFIVEVMGHDSGFIALETGLAGGAEEVFFNESPTTVDQAIDHVRRSMARGKRSSILITAEGKKPGRAYDLAETLRKRAGLEAKVCILGHIQRGGAPSAADRVLASRLGAAAVDLLWSKGRQAPLDSKAKGGLMVGIEAGQVIARPLKDIIGKKKTVSRELLELARVLSS